MWLSRRLGRALLHAETCSCSCPPPAYCLLSAVKFSVITLSSAHKCFLCIASGLGLPPLATLALLFSLCFRKTGSAERKQLVSNAVETARKDRLKEQRKTSGKSCFFLENESTRFLATHHHKLLKTVKYTHRRGEWVLIKTWVNISLMDIARIIGVYQVVKMITVRLDTIQRTELRN